MSRFKNAVVGLAVGVSLALCGCESAPEGANAYKSAIEVYDAYTEADYDNYIVDVDVDSKSAASGSSASSAYESNMGVDARVEVAGDISHADAKVSAGFGMFSFDIPVEAWIDGASGDTYAKMSLMGMFGEDGEETWTKSNAKEDGVESDSDTDLLAEMRPAFEDAEFEATDDGYVVRVNLGDLYAALGDDLSEATSDSENSVGGMVDSVMPFDASDMPEELAAATVTYKFDNECHLIEVSLPETTFTVEEEVDMEVPDGVTVTDIAPNDDPATTSAKTTLAATMKFSGYGEVDELTIPEDVISSAVEDDEAAENVIDSMDGFGYNDDIAMGDDVLTDSPYEGVSQD